MQHFFVDASQVSEETIWIEGSDVNHMKNVLRMRIGEEVTVREKNISARFGILKRSRCS